MVIQIPEEDAQLVIDHINPTIAMMTDGEPTPGKRDITL